MRKIGALVRASWLEMLSYRVKMLFSLAALMGAVVPFFYIAGALQPMVAQSIAQEGGEYFAFLVVGMTTFAFLRTSIGALPAEIGTAISTGTFEALLGTPTRLVTLLAGLVSFSFVWTAIRVTTLLVFAWVLGAQVFWSRALLGGGILALVILAHLPFGLISASLILAFRTAGPLEGAVIWVSMILGGVYYPTTAIPSWLGDISAFVPLTYGLRALRQALLEPQLDYGALRSELLPLCGVAVVLLAVSVVVFSGALRYARRNGTLAQY
jgi:ABC-2 type transport system permease protein